MELGNALLKSEERRTYRRVSDAIGLHIEVVDAANQADIEPVELPAYPTHVVSLSPNGLKVYHIEAFEEGARVIVTLRLFPEKTVMELQAEVVNAGEDRSRSKNDRFFAGLRFKNISEENKSALLEHIDLVARQSFGGAIKLIN